jgi:hypothetical protein
MQRFSTVGGFTSGPIPISIQENIWELLLGGALDQIINLDGEQSPEVEAKIDDYVILPLYSTHSSILKTVPAKSGINQWNAGGRKRAFGEAYIPIPSKVHKKKPGFFPERDQKFELRLPSGEVVSAKVCQQGSKALMSDPNTVLCHWLFSTIDGSSSLSQSRLARHAPYTYEDLERIGKDSVRVHRLNDDNTLYELEFAPLDSYEAFIAGDEG